MDQRIQKAVKAIKSQAEYSKYVERVKSSNAPLEKRDEVLLYAARMHPEYEKAQKRPTKQALVRMIEESGADTYDMIQG